MDLTEHGRVTAAPTLAALVAGMIMALAGCGESGPSQQAAAEAPADLIIDRASIYTLNWDQPAADGTPAGNAPHTADGWQADAEAVAIRDGRIVFVGSSSAVQAYRGADTVVAEVDGATVLPGLVDSHTHIFNLGAKLSRVDLYGVETEEEAVARVEAAARSVPKGEWIVGQGWDEGAWANRYPDLSLLSQRVPDHPVYLRSLHSFAGWGNAMALARAGITADTQAPVGGEIQRFADGRPNGLLLNRAVPLLEDAIPSPDHEELKDRARRALAQMARDGYVTVHDAGVDAAEMAALEDLEAAGELPIRVYAMLSVRDETLARDWLERGPDTDAERFLVTRSVKAFYDGALGSRGARLLEDYSDRPGHRGVSGGQYGFNQQLTEAMMQRGFQVGIHAIGDAGNRETLDFIEAVYERDPATRTHRNRIEHAQVLHPADIARFAELQLVASMEPPHAVEDMAWAEERLGPDRVQTAYAWRSLREAGAHLTFNADNPGSDHDIFYGLHAAITRRDKQRKPTEGWYPQQAVTAEEAVRAYTAWSAYAAFREDLTGVIAPGRWADLTVMDVDPFVLGDSAPGEILDGSIIMTVVDGRVIYPPSGDP
ncbi:MAG: amidohydrolase [Pseudomonadales bacterium]